jgi:hypothetical protein
MSGPKVIEVVTRQQVIDICRAAIAEVDHALAEWQRIMDRNMILAPAERKRLTTARDALQAMLAGDRFLDIQKAAPGVMAAIERSVQEQLAGHFSAAAEQQRQEQSLRLSAGAVLSRLRELDAEVPEDCLRILSEAAAERPVDDQALRQALAQANAALYAKDNSSPSEGQQELARVLGATGMSTSASDALQNAEHSLLDPRVSSVASQISDLAEIGEVETASLFRSRLDKVNQADTAGDTRQRELLLASLEVEITTAVREARQLSALRREIGVESAAAQATNDWEACRVDLREAEAALQRGDTDSARRHLERAKTTRLDRRTQRAAQSSRAAILDGLKELGYEVREGMATQWAEKKQLVVRHAAKPGVALELAGTLDGGRLQARMVTLQGSARDPHADKQTEETWCSEFDSLQKYVARRGGEIRVVKAVAAGAAPLKVVLDDQFEDAKRVQLLRERKLP